MRSKITSFKHVSRLGSAVYVKRDNANGKQTLTLLSGTFGGDIPSCGLMRTDDDVL